MFKRALSFLGRWQEPFFWLPAILAAMIAAWYVIPILDPRSGIDGFGPIWGQLLVAVAVVLSGFFAWALRMLYSLELDDDGERELIDHAAGIERTPDGTRIGHGPESWPAVVILIMDRAQWLALFWLLLSRFAP